MIPCLLSKLDLFLLLFVQGILIFRYCCSRAPTAWTFSNIIAGSDPTRVVLKTTIYNLVAHPPSVQRLYDELLDADKTRQFTRPFSTWDGLRNLPYLDA